MLSLLMEATPPLPLIGCSSNLGNDRLVPGFRCRPRKQLSSLLVANSRRTSTTHTRHRNDSSNRRHWGISSS
ncbi:hypothetical protein ATANTOWER_030389 [Ataeniobius toweri]|uniref:Uncharacterized protein n=1 Tax=Ataeniobius toweri TaxID=208326 RepID=A0ABU7BLS0_9TELE|nr:hypothetical protein [Ataeniobius toweri]